METRIQFDISAQPDDLTCGPTCLHAVFQYFGGTAALEEVIGSVNYIPHGGTVPAYLGCDALERGYSATIYSYELQLFDPTWRDLPPSDLAAKLTLQAKVKESERLQHATDAYLRFLALGGMIRFEDLSSKLLLSYLKRGVPIITGLSSTYLYGAKRENGIEYDDIHGTPGGHFVVLCGYDRTTSNVFVADPYSANPVAEGQYYEVNFERLICAVFLGILTYDSALLIVEPRTSNAPSAT
ncbi:MAG: C39 family peptidase [Bdellovibrionales bacterium]|nr:C39 family peptidase [Bdellovibrionales bacterium]